MKSGEEMNRGGRSAARRTVVFLLLSVVIVCLFISLLLFGAVRIPLEEVIAALTHPGDCTDTSQIIVREARFPMSVAALLTGAALSVAGLMLQTTFRNPLAGPSILGVSSGASLGVAIVMLGASLLGLHTATAFGWMTAIIGALAGAGGVIALLLLLSSMLNSPVMLLIVGVLISYLTSAVISLLNYLAPSEDVKSYVMWGMGSFSGVRTGQLLYIVVPVVALLLISFLLVKPLDAMLLGERYASSMGYRVSRLRSALLCISGALTAVVTAFCGPIGFVGLVVPHIARMLTGSSNHGTLLPATMLSGMAVMLLCTLLTVLPTQGGVLPINVVTPIVGIPVIVYVILKRRKL